MKNFIRVALSIIICVVFCLPYLVEAEERFSVSEGNSFFDISPDGSQLLLSDFERGELWLFNLSEGSHSKIVSLKSEDKNNHEMGLESEQTIRLFSPRWVSEQKSMVVISYDDSLPEPKEAKIWKVNADGSGFQLLTTINIEPKSDPLTIPSYLSYRSDSQLLLYHHYIPQEGLSTISQVNLDGENPNLFLWQKGVTYSKWSPDEQFLAYVVLNSQDTFHATLDESPETFSQAIPQLWVTSKNGGRLKKSSEILYFTQDKGITPLAWSPDSRYLGLFTEVNKGPMKVRELELHPTNQSKSKILHTTSGFPVGNLRWEKRGKKIAYLELQRRDSSQLTLKQFEFKTKKGKLVGVDIETKLTFPDQSVLLGFDPNDDEYFYLLIPRTMDNPKKAGSIAMYSLIRQHEDDDENEKRETLISHLPPHLIYAFDKSQRNVIFCGRPGGCQSYNLSTRARQWLLPNIESIFEAGDFYSEIGNYATAAEIYNLINEKLLERDRWVEVMTRKYLVYKRSQSDKSGAIWTHIQQRIDKGEEPARELFLLASILKDLQEYDEALSLFQQIIKGYPKSLESRKALFENGKIYQSKGEYDFAKNSFGHYVKLYPKDENSSLALLEFGETLLLKNEPGKSIKIFRKVIGLSPQEEIKVRAYLGKARCLEKMNRFQEASKTYQLVLNQEPESTQVNRKYIEEARTSLSRINDFEKGVSNQSWTP